MKRAFLLLVLLCLLPIHALAQFITVPDEIYEALLADEVISSYASTKEELLPLITTLEGCDENNQAECAVIVTPPDGNPELLMLGKVNGHWQITTRSSSVLLNIDIEPFLYAERYAEVQLYYSSEEDERNGVPRAVLTFQREWDDKAGLHWYLTLLTFTDANGWRVYIEAPLRSIYVDVATNYNGGISQRVFYRESTDITCFNLDTILNDVLTEAAKTNAAFLDISIPDWLVAIPPAHCKMKHNNAKAATGLVPIAAFYTLCYIFILPFYSFPSS